MASSEHSLDKTLEAATAESEAEEILFDCKGLPHLFDFSERQDYHQRPEGPDFGFWTCEDTVCKNSPYIKGTDWGIPVNNWQETNTYSEFASTSFFEGSEPEPQHLASIPEYGSPSVPGSRVFSPVSFVNLSPLFAPTTLPSNLLHLFEEDDIEELLAPSQEEAEETVLSPDLAYILDSLPPPSISVGESQTSLIFISLPQPCRT